MLAHLVTSRAEKAIISHGRFTLGLSGGSLVTMLSKELLALTGLDCSKWVVAFCDERLVPLDHPESTYGCYKVPVQEWICVHTVSWFLLKYGSGALCWNATSALFPFQNHLFSKVNIPDSGILTIDSSLPVNECAEDYTRKLKEVQQSVTVIKLVLFVK